MIEALCIVMALVIACAFVALSPSLAPSTGYERPPYPSNPAERAGQPMSPAVARLDRNIRTWLDLDDIETWVKVAREAGLQVPDVRKRAMPADPVAQNTGD